jgi:hypothetical protein
LLRWIRAQFGVVAEDKSSPQAARVSLARR